MHVRCLSLDPGPPRHKGRFQDLSPASTQGELENHSSALRNGTRRAFCLLQQPSLPGRRLYDVALRSLNGASEIGAGKLLALGCRFQTP